MALNSASLAAAPPLKEEYQVLLEECGRAKSHVLKLSTYNRGGKKLVNQLDSVGFYLRMEGDILKMTDGPVYLHPLKRILTQVQKLAQRSTDVILSEATADINWVLDLLMGIGDCKFSNLPPYLARNKDIAKTWLFLVNFSSRQHCLESLADFAMKDIKAATFLEENGIPLLLRMMRLDDYDRVFAAYKVFRLVANKLKLADLEKVVREPEAALFADHLQSFCHPSFLTSLCFEAAATFLLLSRRSSNLVDMFVERTRIPTFLFFILAKTISRQVDLHAITGQEYEVKRITKIQSQLLPFMLVCLKNNQNTIRIMAESRGLEHVCLLMSISSGYIANNCLDVLLEVSRAAEHHTVFAGLLYKDFKTICGGVREFIGNSSSSDETVCSAIVILKSWSQKYTISQTKVVMETLIDKLKSCCNEKGKEAVSSNCGTALHSFVDSRNVKAVRNSFYLLNRTEVVSIVEGWMKNTAGAEWVAIPFLIHLKKRVADHPRLSLSPNVVSVLQVATELIEKHQQVAKMIENADRLEEEIKKKEG